MLRWSRIPLVKDVSNREIFSRTIAINSSVVAKSNDQVKSWNEIPGPSSLPIIGQILHYLPGGQLYNKSQSTDLQETLYKKYGPIVRLDGNVVFPPITFIFEPEVVLNIFRKEDTQPIRPGFESILYHRQNFLNKNRDDPLGLVVGQGEEWKKMRSLVNPIMLQPKTIQKYTDDMAAISEDLVKRIKSIRNKNNKLQSSFLVELNLWALESVALVALGQRLNCFDPNLSEDSPEKQFINAVPHVFVQSQKLDFEPSFWRFMTTPDFRKGMKVYNTFTRLTEFFIVKAMNELKSRGDTKDEEKSILGKLLEIDTTIAVVVAHDLMLAGIDTTSNTMLGLLYLLASYPEKQIKLREEIMSTQEKKRTYTKACIKEAMRIFPVVGGNFRRTAKEHIALGYRIPKNMHIIAGNQHLCAMEEQFPRATEFIPERWIVDKNDPLYYGNAQTFAYAPFGVGARSCIGRRITELEMETLVTKVVENFQLEWSGPSPKRIRKTTMNYFTEPYHFVFKDLTN